MRRRRYRYVVLVTFCLLLSACSNIRTEDERELHAMPPAAPSVIYVKDFDLEPGTFQAESGILPLSPISAAGFIPRILAVPEDSAIRQRELMKLMSSALVDDLILRGSMLGSYPRANSFPEKVGWFAAHLFRSMRVIA